MSDIFDNVWFWGNPLLKPPKSYASHLIDATYGVLRVVTSQNFARCLSHWRRDAMQVETNDYELLLVKLLEEQAINDGVANVQQYIADRLNPQCSARRVSRLLRLISIANMDDELATYGNIVETSYSMDDGGTASWYPSKQEIERKAASIPRICAGGMDGCLGETRNGKLALCYPCHVKLKTVSPFALLGEWYIQEENRLRREHYKQAVDACFKDHYGTISIDEYESYMEAA